MTLVWLAVNVLTLPMAAAVASRLFVTVALFPFGADAAVSCRSACLYVSIPVSFSAYALHEATKLAICEAPSAHQHTTCQRMVVSNVMCPP